VNSIIELIESLPQAEKSLLTQRLLGDAHMSLLSTIIAILALAASIYSAYISRVTLISSKRPFIWGLNYSVIGDQNTIIPIPSKLMLRISNAPAQVIMLSFEVALDNTVLLKNTQTDFVRFPDSGSEWSFCISKDDFENIIDKISMSKDIASRIVVIRYKAIDGSSIYTYELHQKFDKGENQWHNLKEISN
jgi:hypothetical protein